MPRLAALAVLAVALLSPALAASQPASAPSTLLMLRGERVHVSYSPGSLERAVKLQERLGWMMSELSGWTRTQLVLQVRLLPREEWELARIPLPYGFPIRLPPDGLGLPAWGDEGTVELWRRLAGGRMLEAEGLPVRGSVEEAASLATGDLVGATEAVRIGLARAGLGGTESWVAELFTHTVTLSLQARSQPIDVPRIAGVWDSLAGGSEPLSLADYGEGLEIEQWLAFQTRFHRGARRLLDEAGPKVGRELVKLARKRGGVLSAAELLERYPGLVRWRAVAFGGGG